MLPFRSRFHIPLVAGALAIALPVAGAAQRLPDQQRWVGSWATSVQVPEPQNALPAADFTDATLRQIVHLSIGGDVVRVHLSNAFGGTALRIESVHLAKPVSTSSDAIDAASDVALSFSGRASVVIAPGAQYVSDPVAFKAEALSDVAISIYVAVPPAGQTGHPGSRATSYVVHGNHVSDAKLADAKVVEHWYVISGVDVAASEKAYAVVALGDSITDGHASSVNGNQRWSDVLARDLQGSAKTRSVGVLNQGIGGNHLLTDGLGPNVLARLDRDVLAQAGVREVIVLEGINDLGSLARMENVTAAQHAEMVERMIGAFEQVIARAHAEGIRVIGATILPDVGSDYYHPAAENEADRVAVNAWIRAAGHFDAVVDLDKLMADPKDPTRLRAEYDCGDHLHPSNAGYKVMGDAVYASLFAK